jgi:transcriptional regulator with XRE-family HTH domain
MFNCCVSQPSVLSSAVDALFHARRKAGFTQEQVAQKLGKKQEAIARWEADDEGRMSLSQYFDLAVASGRIPLNVILEPIESVRDFVLDHPEEIPSPDLYYSWLRQRSESATVQAPSEEARTVESATIPASSEEARTVESVNVPAQTKRGLPLRENTPALNFTQQHLKGPYENQAPSRRA